MDSESLSDASRRLPSPSASSSVSRSLAQPSSRSRRWCCWARLVRARQRWRPLTAKPPPSTTLPAGHAAARIRRGRSATDVAGGGSSRSHPCHHAVSARRPLRTADPGPPVGPLDQSRPGAPSVPVTPRADGPWPRGAAARPATWLDLADQALPGRRRTRRPLRPWSTGSAGVTCGPLRTCRAISARRPLRTGSASRAVRTRGACGPAGPAAPSAPAGPSAPAAPAAPRYQPGPVGPADPAGQPAPRRPLRRRPLDPPAPVDQPHRLRRPARPDPARRRGPSGQPDQQARRRQSPRDRRSRARWPGATCSGAKSRRGRGRRLDVVAVERRPDERRHELTTARPLPSRLPIARIPRRGQPRTARRRSRSRRPWCCPRPQSNDRACRSRSPSSRCRA